MMSIKPGIPAFRGDPSTIGEAVEVDVEVNVGKEEDDWQATAKIARMSARDEMKRQWRMESEQRMMHKDSHHQPGLHTSPPTSTSKASGPGLFRSIASEKGAYVKRVKEATLPLRPIRIV